MLTNSYKIFLEARTVVFLAYVLNPDVIDVIAIAELVIQAFNRMKKEKNKTSHQIRNCFPNW